MKPRAAGGAQSTRSVLSEAALGASEARDWRLAVRSRAQLERLGAAQWPGAPCFPTFLPLLPP